jgi:hypothetical protein
VRALILALARFEVASKDQTRALEKEWLPYRNQHNWTSRKSHGEEKPRQWADIEDRRQEYPPAEWLYGNNCPSRSVFAIGQQDRIY